MIVIDPADLNPRNQPQDLRNASGARSPDVFLCEDVDRGRRLPDLLRLFRCRGDFSVSELRQTQLRKPWLAGLVGWRGAPLALLSRRSSRYARGRIANTA